jgi:hypothetical protein
MSGTNWLSPDIVQIIVWATVAGAASMLLYRFSSPQQRLKLLAGEAAATRRALNDLDGGFHDAWPLIRRSLALSLECLRIAFVPSLLAGLPVLLALFLMEDKLANATVPAIGPAWAQSGWVAFFLVTAVAAVVIKVALRIK